MNETVSWLIRVESTASNLYAEAAILFREDKAFSHFLSTMALEEKDHEELLQKVSVLIPDNQIKKASFFVDDDFRRKVEAPFKRAWVLMKNGKLTKSEMIDVVAEAEFSEWNELFLYVIDHLNATGSEFKKAVSEVDEHRAHIQDYFTSLPDGNSFIQRVRKLSQSMKKRVLIVEGNYSVARMLDALADDEVEVLIARNGEEGMAYIQKGHFDLIVSDIEMPKMSGVEMYKQAAELDPSIASRFIFFSGTASAEHLNFVRSTNVLMLPKPSPVKVICAMMNDVLDSTTVPQGSTIH
jgi:CheY-like chemotaxis protein